jgi:hypothetical protein
MVLHADVFIMFYLISPFLFYEHYQNKKKYYVMCLIVCKKYYLIIIISKFSGQDVRDNN